MRGPGLAQHARTTVATDIAAGRLVVLPVERWDGSDHLPHLDIVAALWAAIPRDGVEAV